MSNKIRRHVKASSNLNYFIYGILLIGEGLVLVLSLGRYESDWAFNYIFSDKFTPKK